MTIDFPFMTRLSPADAIRVWRHEYEQWKEQTRLLKQFERDRIFCPSASDADQRQHRGWTAALLAKGEGLGLQLDDLPIDAAEKAGLREAIARQHRLRKGNRGEEGAEQRRGNPRARLAGLSAKKPTADSPVSSMLLHGAAARCSTASYSTLGGDRRELLE